MQSNYLPDVANSFAATEIKAFVIAGGTAGAGSDISESVIGRIGDSAGFALAKVTITPSAALTASDTLFVTFTVSKRTAGGSGVTVATATTKTSGSGGTGSWVAWTPVTIPLAANITLAAGDVLTITATHASTGTAVPQSILELFVAVN